MRHKHQTERSGEGTAGTPRRSSPQVIEGLPVEVLDGYRDRASRPEDTEEESHSLWSGFHFDWERKGTWN
jgi:hypothetical protein